MRKISSFLSLLLVAFLVVGCDATQDATETGKEFHELLMAGDYDALTEMISEEGLDASSAEDWTDLFMRINESEIESYKKTGFNTNINNGVTKVTLNYTIELKKEDDTYYEEIIFIKKGDEFKLLHFSINKDKSKL